MDSDTAARRAAMLLEQIADIDARPPAQQHNIERSKPGSAFHEQSVRKLAKTQAQVDRLRLELARARASTDDQALAAATAERVARRQTRATSSTASARKTTKGAKGTKTGSPRTPPGVRKVTVRRVPPTGPNGAPTCRQCGTWAPLHTRAGRCGACLRKHGLKPCTRCSAWLEARDFRKHRCGPDRSNSVNALQGGCPGSRRS